MEIGTRVSYRIYSMTAKALTTQTGSVAKIYKGSDPLCLITEDDNSERQYPTMKLKVRLSQLTKI